MTEPVKPWSIGVNVLIEAKSQDEAEHALRAIERTGKRCAASVNFYVMASEPSDEEGR